MAFGSGGRSSFLDLGIKKDGKKMYRNYDVTLGGWWTDLQKAIIKGAVTGAQLLNLYRQGQITQEQYYELQKIQAAAAAQQSSGIDSKTLLYVGAGVLALFALGIFATSRR